MNSCLSAFLQSVYRYIKTIIILSFINYEGSKGNSGKMFFVVSLDICTVKPPPLTMGNISITESVCGILVFSGFTYFILFYNKKRV